MHPLALGLNKRPGLESLRKKPEVADVSVMILMVRFGVMTFGGRSSIGDSKEDAGAINGISF